MKRTLPAWSVAGGVLLGCIPLVYLVYSLWILRFASGHTYSYLQDFYRRSFPGAFDVETISRYFFTPGWHAWLQGHSAILTGGMWLIIAGYAVLGPRIVRFLAGFLVETAKGFVFAGKVFRELNFRQRVLLSGLFGVMFLYWGYLFASSSGMWLDEACSYLHFVRQGVLFTMMSYPVPNNHILYNVICALPARLSFLSPAWVMRLPSMAATVLDYYIIFCVFRRWADFRRAMVVVAGVAFVHLLSYYAVQGRGYQLQLLFIVVNALSGWYYFFPWPKPGGPGSAAGSAEPLAVIPGSGRFGYRLFVVSAILGFYVNPLFVYHFMAVFMVIGYRLLRKRDRVLGRQLLIALLIIAGTTAVLYLPIFLGSGIHAVAGNKYVANRPWSTLVSSFGILVYDLKYIFYYGYFSILLLIGAFIVFLWFYRRRRLGGFFYDYAYFYLIASVLAIGAVTVYERIYPLERSLCFWVLALNIMFVNFCYDLACRLVPRRAFGLVVMFLLVKDVSSVRLLYLDHYAVRNSLDDRIYREPQPLYPQLAALHPASYQITNSEDSYPVYLQLYLLAHHDPTPVLFSRERAVGTVILFNDSDLHTLPLEGYERWADRNGRWAFDLDGHARVYVSKAAAGRPVLGTDSLYPGYRK